MAIIYQTFALNKYHIYNISYRELHSKYQRLIGFKTPKTNISSFRDMNKFLYKFASEEIRHYK